MKAAALALLLTACAGCSLFRSPPPPRPTYPRHIMLSDEVLQNMFEIQAEYQRETVRCLTGFTVADTVYVTGIEPTWITRADSVSVGFRGCTAAFTLGWYHNHPGWTDDDGARQEACWIEGEDVRTLRGLANFLVAVVTCDPYKTIVWKFKDSNVNYRHTFGIDSRYEIGTERPEARHEPVPRHLSSPEHP